MSALFAIDFDNFIYNIRKLKTKFKFYHRFSAEEKIQLTLISLMQ